MMFNKKKMEAVIHLICEHSAPEKLGATKLNKILFFSDRYSYIHSGKPLTGETYIKRQHGPVPQHVLESIDNLKEQGKIATREEDFFSYTKRLFISLKPPELEYLTKDEINFILSIKEKIVEEYTASSISEFTHNEIWEMAEVGEEIPYETVYVTTLAEPSAEDINWIKNL